MTDDKSTYAVIMAGGSGTRFWPASRRLRPKQLLPLGSELPLIREAVQRVTPLCGADNIYVATGAHLVEPTLAAVPELRAERLLVEPVGRNTAPCIGWAAATIARNDPEAVVMALPSDPHIEDVDGFLQTLQHAVDAARAGTIATVGIKPTHPETGYGYIEAEPGDGAIWRVKRFVEKPSLARAEQFVAAGSFLWNAGMFFFRACDMVAAIRTHLPALAEGLDALDQAAAEGREQERLSELFGSLPAVSIDTGVMEHMDDLAVVPGDFGWSDLGSWLSVSDLAVKDAQNNSAPDGTIFVDAPGNHVVDMRPATDHKRVIALVGVSNLVVVETPDALLVVHRDAAQHVRQVVDALKTRGDTDLA